MWLTKCDDAALWCDDDDHDEDEEDEDKDKDHK